MTTQPATQNDAARHGAAPVRYPAPAIYMAARYSRREEALSIVEAVRSIEPAVESTACWLRGGHQIDDAGLSVEAQAEERRRFAEEDWADLCRADWCVLLTEPPRSAPSRDGRMVEFGAALAMSKTCVVIGPAENVFCCLPQIQRFETVEAFLEHVCGIFPGPPRCRYCRGQGRWVEDYPDGPFVNRICMYCLGSGVEVHDG
jgi:hypothetical protein